MPVISIRLQTAGKEAAAEPEVKLSYRRGAKKITTRLPVVDVAVGAGDLFAMGSTIEILLEAHDKSGNVIGEPKHGQLVNPATHTISMVPGQSAQVAIKMDLEFEGKFLVKALDPGTLKTYSKLELETDYTV